MVNHNSDAFKKEKFLSTLETIEYNGHAYVNGDYETKGSPLEVYCRTHQKIHTTTFDNYCRSKTGMPCCGRAQVSTKLTDRKYTAETLEKMRQAAFDRKWPSGTGQDWRRTKAAREWEKRVKEIWQNECAITGRKSNLVMHHFFSGSREKDVALRDALLYHPDNGIMIGKEFHEDFHKKFGYQKNTLEQFKSYVKDLQMLISSQAPQKCREGSETRVNDLPLLQCASLQLEKIMKLHERLEEISTQLIETRIIPGDMPATASSPMI